MSVLPADVTQRERELAGIINAYNDVTEKLKQSHVELGEEVRRLHEELNRKNEQLRRKERLAALGEMAAGVAHEIRNPLGGIQLFASLLQDDLADQDGPLKLIDRIKTGVGQMETIVGGILDFARPHPPMARQVRLKILVGEAIELCSARLGDRGVNIRVADDSDDIELLIDAGMLQRALLNLLLNAVEATEGHGDDIEVAWSVIDDRVSISIADTGSGIDAELLDRIFNPFVTGKDTGTGLGLAIVHQIAETLGGSIHAANRDEGGAVFTMSVPIRAERYEEFCA